MGSLRIKSSRFTQLLREKGPRFAVTRGLRVACSPLIEMGSLRFFRVRLDDPEVNWEVDSDLEIGDASLNDADDLLIDRPEGEVSKEIRRRFSRGDRCITARDHVGNILHARWLSSRPTYIPEIDRFIVPAPGQLYMYDGYTCANARRRGIDSAIRRFIFHTAREEGQREVFSYVRGRNIAGIKAAEKLQAEIGIIKYIALFSSRRFITNSRRSAPRITLLTSRELERRQQDYDARTRALDQWFGSWLSEPMEKRSTGFSALPESCCKMTAEHIVRTLALDPDKDQVLDVGCSSAVVSRHVAPYALSFHGIDATAGLVKDIDVASIRTSTGEQAIFSVADGRRLPFADQLFDKVYCSGVIHMLPSYEDAMQMVNEMIRVCAPNGQVLLAAVPDLAKAFRGRMLAWRRKNLMGKIKLGTAMMTPRPVRRFLQRLGVIRKNPMAFLEFDLQTIKRFYETRGLCCEVLDFPDDFWSRDFRASRSNLLISKKPG